MEKLIVGALLIAFSWPVFSSDVRIAFSKSENIELFAKSPDASGQWCTPDIAVDIVFSGSQAGHANSSIGEFVKKVGAAVIDPSCPTAQQINIYPRGSDKALGYARKNNQWIFEENVEPAPSNGRADKADQKVDTAADTQKLSDCRLSVDCYKAVINRYGKAIGSVISWTGRGLGVLLFAFAMMSMPVRDRRYKTGYKGNASPGGSTTAAGVAVAIFLACEAVAFLITSYAFFISCIILLIIIFFVLMHLGKIQEQEPEQTAEDAGWFDGGKKQQRPSKPYVMSMTELENIQRALKQAMIRTRKFEDIIDLGGDHNWFEFSLKGLGTNKDRQKAVDQLQKEIGGQDEDRDILIKEWWFDIPTSIPDRPVQITVWFGAHKRGSDGEKLPRGLINISGRENWIPSTKPTDRWLENVDQEYWNYFQPTETSAVEEEPKLPYQSNDMVVINLGVNGAILYCVVYYSSDDGVDCNVVTDDGVLYTIANSEVLGLSKIKELSPVINGDPVWIAERELPDYLNKNDIEQYKNRKPVNEVHA